MSSRRGVLLINVGTPESTSTADVRRYLAEFLMDPRVIAIPAVARWLLVHGIILRTRPRRSAAAYRKIWTDRGSPLLFHGLDLADGLRDLLGDRLGGVELAMRYGRPSLRPALQRFVDRGIDDVLVVPLYPQYSQAAWASAFDAVTRQAARLPVVPRLRFAKPFYAEPAFLDAAAAVARRALEGFAADRVLMSFHGLPESHIRHSDLSPRLVPLRSAAESCDAPRAGVAPGATRSCLDDPGCCDRIGESNRYCYRAQCYATARSLATRLGLADSDYEVAFQSRLTRHWIQPFTDHRLRALPSEGVRRLAVICPSFVADCLETVEEIGLRGAESFRAAGGTELRLVPCVNADPAWVEGLASLVTEEPELAGRTRAPDAARG